MTETLVATTRPALVEAHNDLKAWITRRREGIAVEIVEVEQAVETAQTRQWALKPLENHLGRLRKHLTFLEKVSGAIEAGYAIVPNFDLQRLAVRTDKAYPEQAAVMRRPEVGATRLPAGQGNYVAAEPEFEEWAVKKEGQTYPVTMFRATEHAPIAVPFVLAKKEMAEALERALEEKIFDEIGIVRDARSYRGDPVLVGRIRHPKATRWTIRGVSFFIGWWFEPRTLDM